jgi:glucose/arabinose dehydrogenase
MSRARRPRVVPAIAGLLAALVLAPLTGCIAPPPMRVSTVVSGVDHPWDVGFAGGTMIYTERAGRISAFVSGQKRLLAAPPDVVHASEAGMMGLAIDPDFAINRYIYTCLASTLGGPSNDVRVVRWKVNSGFTALTNRTDIVTGAPVNTEGELGRHSGCRPRFDVWKLLWVGTGDAAEATVPQDPRSLGGKVLRVNRDGGPAPGNPGGALDPRIYSYGHRNVQGIAFRGSDGLGVSTEHGTDRDDELNRLVTGNFGWDPVGPNGGYDESTPMTDLTKFPNAVRPLWASGYPTVAPSGATFVSGSQWGSWNGALLVALLKGSKLLVFKLDSQGRVLDTGLALGNQGRLRVPVQGPDGDIYVTTDNGGGTDKILKLAPAQ